MLGFQKHMVQIPLPYTTLSFCMCKLFLRNKVVQCKDTLCSLHCISTTAKYLNRWKKEVQKGVSGVNPLLVKLRKLSFCSSPPPLPSSPIWAAVDIGREFTVLRGRCDCCCDPWEGNHKVEMHCDKNLLLLFTQSGDRWGGWVISKLLQHSIVKNHECWNWYYMNDHTCYFKGIASSCFASDLL